MIKIYYMKFSKNCKIYFVKKRRSVRLVRPQAQQDTQHPALRQSGRDRVMALESSECGQGQGPGLSASILPLI